MTIEIDVKSQVKDKISRLSFVVQLLQSLEFIEFVRVKNDISEDVEPMLQNKISELLLTGPTMTQSDKNYYSQKQKYFNEWK